MAISADDLNNLKTQWASDPSWDIEHTEGFEAHHDELKAFRERKEAEWERRRQAKTERSKARVEKVGRTRVTDVASRLYAVLLHVNGGASDLHSKKQAIRDALILLEIIDEGDF